MPTSMTAGLLFLLLAVLGAVGTGADADTPAASLDGTAASTNVSGAGYPRVLPDLRIVFHVSAASARSVGAQIDKDYAGVKDADSNCTITTERRLPASIATRFRTYRTAKCASAGTLQKQPQAWRRILVYTPPGCSRQDRPCPCLSSCRSHSGRSHARVLCIARHGPRMADPAALPA